MSLASHLVAFLAARGWREGDSPRPAFRRILPPESAGLGDYYVIAPREENTVESVRLVQSLIEPLASVFDLTPTALEALLRSNSAIVSIQQRSTTTSDGSVPFPVYSSLIDHLKKFLLSSASFIAEEDPLVGRIPEEARYYLSRCSFLQSSVGSYVTNVRLPEGDLLAPDRLQFDQEEPKASEDVNDTIQEIVPWAFDAVLNRPFGFDFSALPVPADEIFSVDAFEALSTLVGTVRDGELNFTFNTIQASITAKSGELTPAKLGRLNEFAKRLRSSVEDQEEIHVAGRIVELRSRNPDKNRNHVYIFGKFGTHEGIVAIRVPKRDYSVAGEAHVSGRIVYASGLARRMRTQYRITKLKYFGLEPPPFWEMR